MLSEVSTLTILLLALLLALSAFFSSSETAFLSAQKVRLRHLAATGSTGARLVEEMISRPGRLLSTILLGNNLVNTAFAALVTVLVEAILGPQWTVAVATVSVTIILLLFGEITPKTIAFNHAERLALLYIRPMQFLTLLTTPITAPLARLTSGFGGGTQRLAEEEEIRTMVATGVEAGAIEEQEAELVEKVFRFGDRLVREVLTPRTEIVWVAAGTTFAELLALYPTVPHTRFPVYRDTVDDVLGVLSIKDVLRARAQGDISDNSVITGLVRPAHFVPETKLIGPLFIEMRSARSQLTLVVDEFGSITGLVTLERLVEEIVGPVGDELSTREPVTTIAPGTFQLEGAMSIEEANEQLALDLPRGDYQTIAGFLLSHLGYIPQEGEQVDYNGLYLVVEEMRGTKIERLLITRRS